MMTNDIMSKDLSPLADAVSTLETFVRILSLVNFMQGNMLACVLQIHTMLFYIAATHILCSVIMHKIGAARIEIWNRWLSDDDAHTTA